MGALARDGGVNFAVFSQHATSIQPRIFGTASSLQSASGIVYTEASPFKIPARAVQVLRGITMNHLPKT